MIAKMKRKSDRRCNIFGGLERQPPSTDQLPTTQADVKTAKLVHERAEWNINSTLQLQRLAHEAIGAGTWGRTFSETPVTLPDQTLGTLSFKKPPMHHPYFINPDVKLVSTSTLEPSDQSPDADSLGGIDKKSTLLTISTTDDSEKKGVTGSGKSLN